eukprot:TRINITY_DN31907_c0_g1_i2.p1 TRINITY_DN31907_c0_g1~~TRINITY_DN31907_c0_g1_i2.p1  ORF type:complete len:599 (-),score=118.61 TRINITY_DN31907_c0_g1_i2:170-1966(-)
MQDFQPEFDSPYNNMSTMYVAQIPNAFVQGEGGLVFDGSGNVYYEKNMFLERVEPKAQVPRIRGEQEMCDVYVPILATAIQRYGHMYYHFVAETLSKVIMLKPFLTEDVKLLIWGEAYEFEYLQMLGIPRSQIEVYNPQATYCAGQLLMPTPTSRITPAKEGLQMVRETYNVEPSLPVEERDLIIYVTRKNEDSRRVSNEDEVLSAIKKQYPKEQLVVFEGSDMNIKDTIDLFKRAKVVMGPHGAGLSHILFSAPNTHVVEFLFMQHPPMMFWHIAAALRQNYWMLPVPHSYWMQDSFEVPVSEVLDILERTIGKSTSHVCSPGSYVISQHKCHACAPGTYAFNWEQKHCQTCPNGRYAANPGSYSCRTCPVGTYSWQGTTCKECPTGTINQLPGAWTSEQCLTANQQKQQLDDPAFQMKIFNKLSPTFRSLQTRRRMQEEQVAETTTISNRMINPGNQNLAVYNRLWDKELYCTLRAENPNILEPYMAPLVPIFDCSGEDEKLVNAFSGPQVEEGELPVVNVSGPLLITSLGPVSEDDLEEGAPKSAPIPDDKIVDKVPFSRQSPSPDNSGALVAAPSVQNVFFGLMGAILVSLLLY